MTTPDKIVIKIMTGIGRFHLSRFNQGGKAISQRKNGKVSMTPKTLQTLPTIVAAFVKENTSY
jgi:hypothetical protein